MPYKQIVTKLFSSSEQDHNQDFSTNINQLVETTEKFKEVYEQINISEQEINQIVSEANETAQCSQGMVDELSSHISQMMERMQETSSSLQLASNLSEQGANSLKTAILEMKTSKEQVSSSIEITTNLQEDIKNLSEMLAAITSIANQTKLLALNASIEAARAGEAGQGFSVVAQEVSKLAVKSKDTADYVSATLNKVKVNTTKVIHSMTEGYSGVEKGMQFITEANEQSNIVVEQVNSSKTAVENAFENVKALDLGIGGVQYMAQEIKEIISKCASISDKNASYSQTQAEYIQIFNSQLNNMQIQIS